MIQFYKRFRRISYLVLLFTGSGLMVASCKKDKLYDVRVEVRDSAYLKIKDIYLWTDLLPSIQEFRPRNSRDIYEVMDRVRSYEPLDRFSFVETKHDGLPVDKNTVDDLSRDFGDLNEASLKEALNYFNIRRFYS